MGIDTIGKIKGYVTYKQVFDFIKSEFDSNATCNVDRRVMWRLSEITWPYAIEPHSDDNENEYAISGFICFVYDGKHRSIFYDYCNARNLEPLQYEHDENINHMLWETTALIMRYNNDSVEIIERIIKHFGSGWIDESDCDSVGYRHVS